MSNDIDRAFQAHITEFNAMRDEINLHIGHQNQLINYAIGIVVGTASLFAFGQPNIAQQEPFLLLVASLLMSGISWSFMEASLQINKALWDFEVSPLYMGGYNKQKTEQLII